MCLAEDCLSIDKSEEEKICTERRELVVRLSEGKDVIADLQDN